jgi:hypothetical protein
MQYCPKGEAGVSFIIHVMPDSKGLDDTALNELYVKCSDGTVLSTDYTGNKGYNTTLGFNPCYAPDSYLVGFQLKSEKPVDGDDTAANDIKFKCSDDEILEGYGMRYGEWQDWHICPEGYFITGLSGQTEHTSVMDETALNNVRFQCGPIRKRLFIACIFLLVLLKAQESMHS